MNNKFPKIWLGWIDRVGPPFHATPQILMALVVLLATSANIVIFSEAVYGDGMGNGFQQPL